MTQDLVVQGTARVKISYLQMSVTNTQDNSDSKEVKVDFPKRSFRNIKATQNSVIKLKVKLNTNSNKIEQFFLRLKHNELNKVATGYSSEYNQVTGLHIIELDISDHHIIDAYDGIYEMSIILSDPSLDNPVFWNFGKIEIKFSKPMDPLSITESYKNQQKQKIEHSFTPAATNKTSKVTPIFSLLILVVFGLYLNYLRNANVNFDKFPRENKNHAFMAFLYVVVISLYAYFLFLFWVKFNILQTLFILAITGIPGSVIIFKTMIYVQIDI